MRKVGLVLISCLMLAGVAWGQGYKKHQHSWGLLAF